MIYLLRHAKTDFNCRNIVSGQSDSQIVSNSISLLPKQQFEFIYSSPSKRCVETLSYLKNPITPPIYDNRLLERNMGKLEGKTKESLKADFPNLFIKTNNRFYFDLFQTPPNGESFSCFYERIYSFYQDYIVTNNNKTILICSHNQVLKMLYFIITKTPLTFDEWIKANAPHCKIIDIKSLFKQQLS